MSPRILVSGYMNTKLRWNSTENILLPAVNQESRFITRVHVCAAVLTVLFDFEEV